MARKKLMFLSGLLSFSVLLAQAPRPPRPPKPGVKAPGVKIPMSALKPEAVFGVPGTPDWIAIDESVWISNNPYPETNLIVESIPVGKAPRFLAVGGGFVWTLNQTGDSVSKVDPKTNKLIETIEVGVPGGGGEIAFGEGSLWVTAFEFPVSRIDPTINKVVQQFADEGGDAIRVGLGSVWLSALRAGTVWRLDPRRIQATVAL